MKNIKALILDLDHCLYQDPKDKNARYEAGAVKAAVKLGLCKDFEEATRLVRKSVLDHRSEIEEFARRPGMLRNSIFTAYHEESLPLFLEAVSPVPGLSDSLAALSDAGVQIAVLTHSAREWAVPMIKHLGLSEIIPETRIWALNDPAIDFSLKSKSERPFATVCTAMDVSPRNVLMADDVDKNLFHPHKMGMTTVQIAWEAATADAPKPVYVHHKPINLGVFLKECNFN